MFHNHVRVLVTAAAVAGILAVASSSVIAQAPADDTKVNTRDRAAGAVTADQQKDNPTDLDLTKRRTDRRSASAQSTQRLGQPW